MKNSASPMLLLVVMVIVIFGGVQGYGTGAPAKACGTMTPGHGSRQSSSMFSITASSSTYNKGGTVTGENVQVLQEHLAIISSNKRYYYRISCVSRVVSHNTH